MVNISVLMIVKQSPLMKTPCFITFPCSTILRPPTNHSNVKKIENNVELWVKMLKQLNIMDKSYTAVTSMVFYFYWLAFFRKFFGQNSLEGEHEIFANINLVFFFFLQKLFKVISWTEH